VTKTVQAVTVNKSLQFRRRLRDFFAPVWGLSLVAMYVPVHDKIRSEGFAVAANISRRSGGALKRMHPNSEDLLLLKQEILTTTFSWELTEEKCETINFCWEH
jgi:hypothetical protein